MSGKLDYINMIKKVSPYNLKKGILYLRHYGPKGFWIKLTERFQKSDIDYKEWYENHRPSEQELERERKQYLNTVLRSASWYRYTIHRRCF